MNYTFLLEWLLVGFAIAIPVGPIGVLCIQRSLTKGPLASFVTGLGAATADTFYGAVVAFSITFISDFFLRYHTIIGIVGIAFLLFFGIKIWREKPSSDISVDLLDQRLWSYYLSAVFLTLTNVMTIITFTAIFATVNLSYPAGNLSAPLLLTSGVFFGSGLWWLVLSQGVSFFKKKMTHRIIAGINKVSAVIMFLSVVLLVIHLVRS